MPNQSESDQKVDDDRVAMPRVCFEWDNDYETYVIGPVIKDIDPPNENSIPLQQQKDFEWYAYISIPAERRKTFEASHPHEPIKRYWKNVNDDGEEKENDDHLSEDQLDRIFAVLNYYYTGDDVADSEGPLHHRNRRREANRFSAQFNLKDSEEKDHRYELKWWNQKGRLEPTAIAIQNKRNQHMYYLRLNARRKEL
eukprot:871407_1